MAKEFFGTGESAVRPDKPYTDRQVVVAVIENPEGDQFLCMRRKIGDRLDFVMGGIEGDETPVEAALREVLEESGYSDVEIIEELPETYFDNFYAAHKDVNRHIEVHTVHGRLKSMAKNERSDEEKDIADIVWVDVADLPEKLSTEAQKYDFERISKTSN